MPSLLHLGSGGTDFGTYGRRYAGGRAERGVGDGRAVVEREREREREFVVLWS